jgi:hypothetical protein
MNLKEILEKNNLNDYSYTHGTDKDTVHCYVSSFYEEAFAKYKNLKINMLEIGIFKGASLKLWSEYFDEANILGVDILDQVLPQFRELKNVDLMFDNAYSQTFLNDDRKFNILIDDGPHTLESQLIFLNKYLPKMDKDSILIIEDVASISYVPLLEKLVPEEKYKIEIIDTRHIKNRYDDIMFVVRN